MAAHAPKPILPYFEGPNASAREERFWSYVDIQGPDDCWEWQRARTKKNGYGRFKVASYEMLHANRVAWTLEHRCDPGVHIIRHACDNPPCCNPAHLEIGTHADNTADKMARGRWRGGDHGGSKNPRAKLTEDDLPAIIDRFRRGWTNKAIARELPVDHALVSRIRVGRSWLKQSRALGWEPRRLIVQPARA